MTLRRRAMALLLLAAACSGGPEAPQSPTVDESKPVLQPDGPLLGLGLTTELADDGSVSEPRLAFTTDDLQATAVVMLGTGVQEGATLTVAWFRIAGPSEREHLFSHEITVGPGGRAFSQGVTQAGLAPGNYETVAFLEDRQVRAPWIVSVAGGSGEALSSLGAGSLPLLSLGSVAQQEDEPFEPWDVPDSGDSGWSNEPPTQPEDPPPPGPCAVFDLLGDLDAFAPVIVEGYVYWTGTCSSMTLSGTVSGPPTTIASSESVEQVERLGGTAPVCSLSGGSDIPGTVVRLAAQGSEGAAGTGEFTLPDFGEAGAVHHFLSTPEQGARVKAGDVIVLEVMATLILPAHGIDELLLFAGDEQIGSARNLSGTSEPVPCDYGRLVAHIAEAMYEVPEDPPPVITIRAETTDFLGRESSDSISFYTGEVWEGTVTGEARQPGCSPSRVPVTGRMQIVVGDDGAVVGSVTEGRAGFSCGGTPAPAYEKTFPVSGQKTATGFDLNIGSLPVDGTHATATFVNEGNAGYGATVTYTIDCVACE